MGPFSHQDYFRPALNGHLGKKTIYILIDTFLFVGTQSHEFLPLNIYLQSKVAKILNF